MTNTLIIGAGTVAAVAAHKCAQHNDLLGEINIASRTLSSCDAIIQSIHRKKNQKKKNIALYARRVDATNTAEVVELIRTADAGIVICLAAPYCNMPVLEACIETGAAYIDTSVHVPEDFSYEPFPWYRNHEWKRRARCKEKGITAILSAGFDPGVVNAYCAYARKHHFQKLNRVDIMDVNAGDHGKYFATNFDPMTNIQEIIEPVGYWEDRQFKTAAHHSVSRTFEFPRVGNKKLYLMGHDELHSLPILMDIDTVRFWMGFSEHYINCLTVFEKTGLLSFEPVTTKKGIKVAPIEVLKACLPDPRSLAPGYSGLTCIGNLIQGVGDAGEENIFIYNITDHRACYEEVEAHAIGYTAGVPAVAAAILVARGPWDCKRMKNIEELDPDPFIELLDEMGLKTEIIRHKGEWE